MGHEMSAETNTKEVVEFTVCGEQHTVRETSRITPLTSLNTYLRDVAGLRDTKVMCREGGCGACIVAATVEHPVLRRKETMAVNSCLIPVLSCHGWDIQTMYGIGNRQIGYHPIQAQLAKFNGSQCGYCSGGMVMNMYALQESNDILTMQEIEESFGGYLCRCTGYRPILDAFKSLAVDADAALVNKRPDIEDIKMCPKIGKKCSEVCKTSDMKTIEIIFAENLKWFKVYTIADILNLFTRIGNASYRLVGGNTGQVQQNGSEIIKGAAEYINFDMNKCVLKAITIPPIDEATHLFQSYKICPRSQNAHAYVNAGFLVKYEDSYKVTSARIIYGGIHPNFTHAEKTEQYLVGKTLFDNSTIQGALETLNNEINPDYVLPDATPDFRKNLARNLFYKFVLASVPPEKVNPKYQSGGTRLERNVATSSQFYQTNESMYPITQPVQKIEGLIQCSGEAHYIDDRPPIPGELFGAFVLAETKPLRIIEHVDTAEAMKMPGVVTYVDHNDILGKNIFTLPVHKVTEELFCVNTVRYNGQPVGLILAKSEYEANAAATKVKIIYKDTELVPEYTIKSVLDHKKRLRILNVADKVPTKTGSNVKHIIKGEVTLKEQYHFTMETQRCICVPNEDGGLDMYPGTQWMAACQLSAALALMMPVHKIRVSVRRVGGGYGAKILRAVMVSTACAVAANKVKKPVRVILPLTTNMKAIGKRFASYAKYEAGVDDNGVIQNLNCAYYQGSGISGANEQFTFLMNKYMKNSYDDSTWKLNGNIVLTDMAGNAYARAPSTSEAIAFIETIMENISYATGKDPLEVRKANLLMATKDTTEEFINDNLTWSEYYERKKKVDDYNKQNRWKKRGISFALMEYPIELLFYPFSVFMSVYPEDGTVVINHSGIEIGQGINTKVVQVCAYMLKIPMSMIKVAPSSSQLHPLSTGTSSSVTSEAVCYATIHACKKILVLLEPVRIMLKDPTWQELVAKAAELKIALITIHMYLPGAEKPYKILGACVAEVHVDMLTGEHVLERVDLLEDVGQSISPGIDVGQIEGAFVMGLGNHTCENIVYGDNGDLLTYSTWTYKIPGAKDIPADFRVKFKQDSSNPKGVLNSKATGEPAVCLAIAVPFAIRRAIASAKEDAKEGAKIFVDIDGPTSVEFTLQNASSDYKIFTL